MGTQTLKSTERIMEILKKAIELIFSPLGITVILIGTGIALNFTGRHERSGRGFLFAGGLLFLLFLLFPISDYLILQLESDYPPMLNPPSSPKLDRIVVLAGYAEEHIGFPVTALVSEQTIYSMSEGLRLYRLLPGAKIITSGGIVRRGEKPVAATMSEFLQQMGVPQADIIVEGRSRNTYENLVEVRKWVGSSPFILVTQACDLRRAMGVARKLQMHPIAAPACHRELQYYTNKGKREQLHGFLNSFAHPSTDRFKEIQWAYHEYVGYVWYQLLGRI
jgi:uncharacterized SAM-binding protein YcdF (DUF218 family)